MDKNVTLAPDPAFSLEAIPFPASQELKDTLSRQCLGINLSPLLARCCAHSDLAAWKAKAGELLKELLDAQDLPLLLIPHVTSAEHDTRMDDFCFMQDVRSLLPAQHKKRIAIVSPGLSAANLKWVIGQTSLFIGARTHSTIAALSSCVPCISIAYSRKAWGINRLVFENNQWVLDAAELTPQPLVERTTALLGQADQVRLMLTHKIPELIRRSQEAAVGLRTLVSAKEL